MSSTFHPLLLARESIAEELHVDEMAQQICSGRDQDRHRAIAEAAYFRAQRRGFAAGHELDDWIAAENEREMVCNAL